MRVIPCVMGGLRALSVACVTNPIGLIIGGLLLTAGLIITHWQRVKTVLLTLWEPIKPVWLAFASWVKRLWQTICKPFEALNRFWQRLHGHPASSSFTVAGNAQNRLFSASRAATPMHPLALTAHEHALLAPLKPTTVNRVQQHNAVTIHLHAHPHQDTQQIADVVMQRFQQQSQGALYDSIGVPS